MCSKSIHDSIRELKDDELFAALKKNNLKFGPIVSSTRQLYEKILHQHLMIINKVDISSTSRQNKRKYADDIDDFKKKSK